MKHFRRILVAVSIVLFLLGSSLPAQGDVDIAKFGLISYNIRGMFPTAREEMGRRLNLEFVDEDGYFVDHGLGLDGIIAVQEDFQNFDSCGHWLHTRRYIDMEYMSAQQYWEYMSPQQYWGECRLWDDGLNIFSDFPFVNYLEEVEATTWPDQPYYYEIVRKTWNELGGGVEGVGTKGFTFTRLKIAEDVGPDVEPDFEIDVYNIHTVGYWFDYSWFDYRWSRRENMDQLAEYIYNNSAYIIDVEGKLVRKDRPVIVVGDTNLHWNPHLWKYELLMKHPTKYVYIIPIASSEEYINALNNGDVHEGLVRELQDTSNYPRDENGRALPVDYTELHVFVETPGKKWTVWAIKEAPPHFFQTYTYWIEAIVSSTLIVGVSTFDRLDPFQEFPKGVDYPDDVKTFRRFKNETDLVSACEVMGNCECKERDTEGACVPWYLPHSVALDQIMYRGSSNYFLEAVDFEQLDFEQMSDHEPVAVRFEWGLKTEAPEINEIFVDECFSEFGTSAITVSANDPAGGTLTYEWEAPNGGEIIGSGAQVEFKPDATGPYQVTVTVKSSRSTKPASHDFDICVGDGFDDCTYRLEKDGDDDQLCGNAENCPEVFNPDQADEDGDGLGDVCDNCPEVQNSDQADSDGDGVADACEVIEDLYSSAKDNDIKLTWSPMLGAASYNIYRSTTAGGPYALVHKEHITDDCRCADSNLKNGTSYYYTVRWLDSDGRESFASNEASAKTESSGDSGGLGPCFIGTVSR